MSSQDLHFEPILSKVERTTDYVFLNFPFCMPISSQQSALNNLLNLLTNQQPTNQSTNNSTEKMENYIMSYEGVKIYPRMRSDVSFLITNWAETQLRPDVTLENLDLNSEITKEEMKEYKIEIKFYISRGLPEADAQTLRDSSKCVSRHKKTQLEKEMAYSRSMIKTRIDYIYKALLKQLYRSLPVAEPDESIGDVTISSSEDETIPSSEDETPPTDTNDDVESLANISLLSL